MSLLHHYNTALSMEQFHQDSRLLRIWDTETGEEAWLRRYGLLLRTRKDLHYILRAERRGSDTPLTKCDIEEHFLGPEFTRPPRRGILPGRYCSSRPGEENGEGICYHLTQDLAYTFFKWEAEAPAVGHILWSTTMNELSIRSIVADAEFRFRALMYHVLLHELKKFVTASIGYEHAETITATIRNATEKVFYERNAFRVVEIPGGTATAYWQPEFEGMRKMNRWHEQDKS